jgi:para-nitrobenzyl esterase
MARLLALLLCAFVLATARQAAAAASPPEPVIIDTDVGDDIDDAFALAIALKDPRLHVIGITTAWGDTRSRTLLVRRLLETMGRTDVVVAQGPQTPNSTAFTQKKWADGAVDKTEAPDAIEFIRDQVAQRPGQITLIALAPLSNIEALQSRSPDTLHKLKQVALMGGSIYRGYNLGGAIPTAQPNAEWNVVSAPQGLRVLLRSGVPVRMFPLDSTQIKLDEVRRDRMFAYGSPATDSLALLYHQWRLLNSWGQITPTLFDVVPVLWLLQPAACPLKPLHIEVDSQGYTRPGQGPANVSACLTLDENAAQELIMNDLAPAATLVAQTTSGSVAGVPLDDETVTFKGVPYAAPPVGALRWRPPQAPASWQGVRDASHFGADCIQTPYVIPTGQQVSEDCLTVSVWTHADYRNTHRPVMVFLYGGAFIGGSAAYPLYDGARLAKEGVVVVGLNYRVGIFGFLAHPRLSAESPQHVSGNYGLLDQLAALRWVKDNIEAFGGDRNNVTVFGESAGAVSIAVLLTSPLSKGLFERAILQSPTLPPLADLAAAEAAGSKVGTDLAALRQLDAAELLKRNDSFFPRQAVGDTQFPAPIQDGYLFPQQPRAVFANGALNPVPLIVGINADEGRMFAGEGASAAASAALGDATFVESARWIARGSSRQQAKTFAYVFTRSVSDAPLPPTHSEELAFVFGSLDQPSFIKHPVPNADDWRLSQLMMRVWARFATTGDPNGPGLPQWPRYQRATDPYLDFGTPVHAGKAFRKAQLDALDRAEAP